MKRVIWYFEEGDVVLCLSIINYIFTFLKLLPECWTQDGFKEVVFKASSDKHYQAMEFYLGEHPLLLAELLIELRFL